MSRVRSRESSVLYPPTLGCYYFLLTFFKLPFTYHSIRQHKDYASFLKDRLDTIRVYHSVNGDMSCLKDYYSARGLEQHLHFQQNLCLQQKQRRLIAAVLSEQMRQKQGGCKDPEALQQQAALQTAEALEAAQQRAAMDAVDVMATTQTDEESVCDNHSSVSGDDDEPLSPAVRSHPGREEALVRPSEVNVPMPDLSLTAGKLNGVDIVSLRTMNMHLLNKMRAKVAAKSKKINSCNNNELSSSTLEELDKELEQWETLYRMQLHRRDSLSQQSSSSKPSTSVSLDYIASTFTNHALAVSNIRRDSLSTAAKSFSMNPSLISLQQQGFPLHTTAQQIQREARLTYRNEATTSISKVRRDSLAGAHSLIMEDL